MINLIKKLWNESRSEIIAGLVVASIIGIYTFIIKLKTWRYILSVLIIIGHFFLTSLSIPIWGLLIISGSPLLIYLVFHNKQFKDIIHKALRIKKKEKLSNPLREFKKASTVFFSDRMADAFPGIRELEWFNNPKEIIERLSILLRDPTSSVENAPLWWLRGSESLQIKKFNKISNKKFLINTREYVIDKIAVFRGRAYYQDFIYCEIKPDSPIGIYQHSKDDIARMIEDWGYASEEYGLYKNIPIKRTEYDDDSAIIKGKVVDTFGAELRYRYLSRYNFIICAHGSPLNAFGFESAFDDYMDSLLNQTITFQDFLNDILKLPKNRIDVYNLE